MKNNDFETALREDMEGLATRVEAILRDTIAPVDASSLHIDHLDLTDPKDFLVAIYHAWFWPLPAPIAPEHWQQDYPIVERLLPIVLNPKGRGNAVRAAWDLLTLLGGIDERGKYGARKEWFAVFRALADRGQIGPIAYGAVVSFLATVCTGNSVPGHRPESLEARAIVLNDIRRSSPMGLMNRAEREEWRKLPATVTVYRGGCTTADMSVADTARGIHWALTADYASIFMRGRNYIRSFDALQSAPAIVRDYFMGKNALNLKDPRIENTLSDPEFVKSLGTPFLMKAEIPREMVLAYWARGADLDRIEVLVDCGNLSPDALIDITPERYRLAS